MCIIAIKQAGKPMWSQSELQTMWNNNKDGAGFMFVKDGKVHIQKGFMEFKHLIGALTALGKEMNIQDMNLIMHFRITTHGGTKAENTHPFPVSNRLEDLQKTAITCPFAVAHNGIISKFAPTYNSKTSDTMEYIMQQLYYLYKIDKKFYTNKYALDMIKNTIGSSKLAFLTNTDEIITVGDFQYDEAGRCYSNSSYKNYSYSLYTHYDYSNYDYNYGHGTGWSRNKYYESPKQLKYDLDDEKVLDEALSIIQDDATLVKGWYVGSLVPLLRKKVFGAKATTENITLSISKRNEDMTLQNKFILSSEHYDYFIDEDGNVYISDDYDMDNLSGIVFYKLDGWKLNFGYVPKSSKAAYRTDIVEISELDKKELQKSVKHVFVIEDMEIVG